MLSNLSLLVGNSLGLFWGTGVVFFFFNLSKKGGELRGWVIHQNAWRFVLDDLTIGKDHDFVALYDRVEPVGNSDHSGALELRLNELLNFLLCNDIDVGCGLVEYHDLA